MADDAKNDIAGSNVNTRPEEGKLAPAPKHDAGVPAPDLARESAMQADIQKILGSVKLPERRIDQKAPAPKEISVAPITHHLEEPVQQTSAVERPIVTPVHTLKDDIQHIVREEKMSLVRAATLEEARKTREKDETPSSGGAQRKRRVTGVIFATILLVSLGLAALFGVFLVMNHQAGIADIPQKTLVFAEQNLSLPIENVSANTIKQQVAQLRNVQSGSLGSITRVVPLRATTTPDGAQALYEASTREFFAAIGLQPPEELLRALDREFFFGIHSADKNAPVLVIPVLTYDTAFAGMLDWEPRLNAELAPIFTLLPAYKTDADGIPSERAFSDAVIRNYDTRILTDEAETIQLYYSFPSPRILIIAENPYTFAEVVARLRAQRRL